jgi:Spy/CpxP family protein refolding chaperone
MKTLPLVLLAVPFFVLAGPPEPGPRAGATSSGDAARFDHMEQRMRAARAMGLVEALELNDADAARLRETLTRYDDQRKPLMRQVHDSMLVLRDAASGDKGAQRQVDESVRRVFDARAKLESVDREMYQEIARDLSPEKRARAAVFLARFQGRFGMGMGPGGSPGPGRGPGGAHGAIGERGMRGQ